VYSKGMRKMALKILIVDDSGVMRAMIKKTLLMTEIPIDEIFEASDGRQGLEILNRQWVDLVIADINMPVMNGEEMISHMKERIEFADIPIIVVSTEGSETRIDRLQEKGLKFIRKPFSPEKISDTVNALIHSGESHE
jgi:two-component system, chemotaxis family, chemotaxis protein CheY